MLDSSSSREASRPRRTRRRSHELLVQQSQLLALESQLLRAQATQSTQSQPQATQSQPQPQATQSTQSQPATGRPGVIAAGPQSTTQAQAQSMNPAVKWKRVHMVSCWKGFFLKALKNAHLKELWWKQLRHCLTDYSARKPLKSS